MALDAPPGTLGDLLESMPELSTFNQLVRRSGVIEKLDEEGPYTVFAPPNDAFDALPPNALGDLVKAPADLASVMSYHVVAGLYPLEAVAALPELPTLFGRPVSSVNAENGTFIGGARIDAADIAVENGMLHVISAVMFPL